MASSLYEDFFQYTSGRWIHDEQRKKVLCFQRFNVDALKSVSASSVNAVGVTGIRKLAEGRCNKVFQVQLTEGGGVIARIPTPLAGPPHLVTASEVATMDFLRNRLGLKQVPRVLSWSSRANDTPVEAEYIIMDVVDGVELCSVWHQLTMNQKLMVVLKWVEFEKTVINAFDGSSSYGSLYYRKDLPAEDARDVLVNGQIDKDYVLGPSPPQTLWEDRHGFPKDLKLDCGPWSDLPSYLQSLSNSERAWITKFGSPPVTNGRTFIAPWEVPPHLQALERDGSIEISGVIDWQHTAALPLYLTAVIPQFIDGEEPAPGQAEEEVEKEKAYLRTAYHAFYHDTGYDIAWASSLSFGGKWTMPQKLSAVTRYCWHGGNVELKNLLICVVNEWEKIVGPAIPCPLGAEKIPDEVVVQAQEDQRSWFEMEDALWEIANAIGVEINGWVSNDDYKKAVSTNEMLRKAWIKNLKEEEKQRLGGVDPAELWPFKGLAESHVGEKQG